MSIPVDPERIQDRPKEKDKHQQEQAAQARTFQGSYTIKPDGTGMLTLNYAATPSDVIGTDESGNPIYSQAGLTARYAFVVVNNKLEFRAIRGDGYTSSASFVRQ